MSVFVSDNMYSVKTKADKKSNVHPLTQTLGDTWKCSAVLVHRQREPTSALYVTELWEPRIATVMGYAGEER